MRCLDCTTRESTRSLRVLLDDWLGGKGLCIGVEALSLYPTPRAAVANIPPTFRAPEPDQGAPGKSGGCGRCGRQSC